MISLGTWLRLLQRLTMVYRAKSQCHRSRVVLPLSYTTGMSKQQALSVIATAKSNNCNR